MKTIEDINNVLVVGAGTLGMRIALRCALDGYQVTMFDIKPEQLSVAVDMQTHLAGRLLRQGAIDQAMLERAQQNLRMTSDVDDACDNVDLVSESIIENLDIKKAFYSNFAPRLDDGVVLTTNTSSLLPSDIVESVRQADHFCAFHFHDVFNQTVVDVMPHPGTALWVNDLLMEFGRRIHQIPVFIRKESPGYLFNAILISILGQAGSLAVNEIGSVQDIDRSFMGNFKTPVGPFGMLDQIGLDTAWHITSVRTDDNSKKLTALLASYIDQGKLGFKSGEGFYTYPKPAYSSPDFLSA